MLNIAPPTGLKRECLVYSGFTPAATNVPPPDRFAYRDGAYGAGYLVGLVWGFRGGWFAISADFCGFASGFTGLSGLAGLILPWVWVIGFVR